MRDCYFQWCLAINGELSIIDCLFFTCILWFFVRNYVTGTEALAVPMLLYVYTYINIYQFQSNIFEIVQNDLQCVKFPQIPVNDFTFSPPLRRADSPLSGSFSIALMWFILAMCDNENWRADESNDLMKPSSFATSQCSIIPRSLTAASSFYQNGNSAIAFLPH